MLLLSISIPFSYNLVLAEVDLQTKYYLLFSCKESYEGIITNFQKFCQPDNQSDMISVTGDPQCTCPMMAIPPTTLGHYSGQANISLGDVPQPLGVIWQMTAPGWSSILNWGCRQNYMMISLRMWPLHARYAVYDALCMVHSISFTVHGALCTVYCVLCMMHRVRCTVYCSQWTVYCVLSMMHGARCTVHCGQCRVYCAWCTVYYAWCLVHGVLCTVCGAECTVHGA